MVAPQISTVYNPIMMSWDYHYSNPVFCFGKPPLHFIILILLITLITCVEFLYVQGPQKRWPRYQQHHLSFESRSVMVTDHWADNRVLFSLHISLMCDERVMTLQLSTVLYFLCKSFLTY